MSYQPIGIRCSACQIVCPRDCYDLNHPGQCHDRRCVSNMPRPRVIRVESTGPPNYYAGSSFSGGRPRFDYERDRDYDVAYVSPPPSPRDRRGKYPPSASRSGKYYDQDEEDYDRPSRRPSVKRSSSKREPSVSRARDDYQEPSRHPSMKRSSSKREPSGYQEPSRHPSIKQSVSHRAESKSKSSSSRVPTGSRMDEPEWEPRRPRRSSRPYAEPEYFDDRRSGPQFYSARPRGASHLFSTPKSPVPFHYKYMSTEDPDGTVLDEVPPEAPMPPSAVPEFDDDYEPRHYRSSKYR